MSPSFLIDNVQFTFCGHCAMTRGGRTLSDLSGFKAVSWNLQTWVKTTFLIKIDLTFGNSWALISVFSSVLQWPRLEERIWCLLTYSLLFAWQIPWMLLPTFVFKLKGCYVSAFFFYVGSHSQDTKSCCFSAVSLLFFIVCSTTSVLFDSDTSLSVMGATCSVKECWTEIMIPIGQMVPPTQPPI